MGFAHGACRVPVQSIVVNAAEHRGGRRQGPRLPSRRGEARHLPRLQDIQHLARPGKDRSLLFLLSLQINSLLVLRKMDFFLLVLASYCS